MPTFPKKCGERTSRESQHPHCHLQGDPTGAVARGSFGRPAAGRLRRCRTWRAPLAGCEDRTWGSCSLRRNSSDGCGSTNRNSKMGCPDKWKHGPKPAVCPSRLILSHTHMCSVRGRGQMRVGGLLGIGPSQQKNCFLEHKLVLIFGFPLKPESDFPPEEHKLVCIFGFPLKPENGLPKERHTQLLQCLIETCFLGLTHSQPVVAVRADDQPCHQKKHKENLRRLVTHCNGVPCSETSFKILIKSMSGAPGCQIQPTTD